MIRFAKRLIGVAACIVVALVLVRFGPTLWVRIFGGGNTQWISERFSETLREKNELVVYEVEITGQETVSQDAWLLGTVQKVEMPYTFQMSFTVDLSQAVVSAGEGLVEVRLPFSIACLSKAYGAGERGEKIRLALSPHPGALCADPAGDGGAPLCPMQRKRGIPCRRLGRNGAQCGIGYSSLCWSKAGGGMDAAFVSSRTTACAPRPLRKAPHNVGRHFSGSGRSSSG